MQIALPYETFQDASRALLESLHARYGFDLWMVTRTCGDDWIVLSSLDHGYSVQPGHVFRWSDSLCSRMVQGFGPVIAPRTADVATYRDAPIAAIVPIKAYVGLPIAGPDGELFGTLCAIDPQPQSTNLLAERPVLEMFARLLSSILAKELRAQAAERRAERAEVEALTDHLTGLYNRRGWDRLLEKEEARCRRYGHPASILYIDLDGLKAANDSLGHKGGDEMIRRTAGALRRAARASDVLARLGGDEFAMLLPDTKDPARVIDRVHVFLRDAGLGASIGSATRHASGGLPAAFAEADAAMYEEKRGRRIGLEAKGVEAKGLEAKSLDAKGLGQAAA